MQGVRQAEASGQWEEHYVRSRGRISTEQIFSSAVLAAPEKLCRLEGLKGAAQYNHHVAEKLENKPDIKPGRQLVKVISSGKEMSVPETACATLPIFEPPKSSDSEIELLAGLLDLDPEGLELDELGSDLGAALSSAQELERLGHWHSLAPGPNRPDSGGEARPRQP